MTKKKIIYIVLGVVALVLVYFNYYGSDKEVGDIKKNSRNNQCSL